MSDFLSAIIERKKREIKKESALVNFQDSLLQAKPLAVIAEIKRKSPSKGVLNALIDPVELAGKYIEAGASAISVLTDKEGFGGTIEDLKAVANAFPKIALLRKDFLIDYSQIYETARSGAHAVLLIVKVLNEQLPSFIQAVQSEGMQPLVEVHDLKELAFAQKSGATLIGVNNRNLSTFELKLQTAVDLAPHFAPGIVRVAESGIASPSDAALMRASGYHAILVGESLMTSKDPQALIRGFCHAD